MQLIHLQRRKPMRKTMYTRFLAHEEEVILKAYAFQLSKETEADGLNPMFEAIGQAMRTEEKLQIFV